MDFILSSHKPIPIIIITKIPILFFCKIHIPKQICILVKFCKNKCCVNVNA